MLSLADLLPLAKEEQMHRSVGLVDGYPLQLYCSRELGAQEQTSFGIYVLVVMPVWKVKTWEGCLHRSVGFEFRLWAGNCERAWSVRLFDGKKSWEYKNMFTKPWEEVIFVTTARPFLVARSWWKYG